MQSWRRRWDPQGHREEQAVPRPAQDAAQAARISRRGSQGRRGAGRRRRGGSGMKRRCEESVPLIGPYLDGELPEEDLVWLEEHLSDCDACTARKNLLVAQGEALRERAAARARDVDLSGVADAVIARI